MSTYSGGQTGEPHGHDSKRGYRRKARAAVGRHRRRRSDPLKSKGPDPFGRRSRPLRWRQKRSAREVTQVEALRGKAIGSRPPGLTARGTCPISRAGRTVRGFRPLPVGPRAGHPSTSRLPLRPCRTRRRGAGSRPPGTLTQDATSMTTTDLGACEWFVWDLRRSNLIDRGQLDQIIGDYLQKNPGAEPPALAEFLIGQGVLTDFQVERLLQGKTQGFVLGPFTLMDALGSGSMGTVYKAKSKNDNRWYAVKVLPRRSMWNVRIARRKVRLFEQCRHPAVVPFVDVGTAGGMHYLAWPMVEGQTLDKIVEKQGKLSVGQTAQYALQAAEGLELCHRQSLFHGLLKPSNLMVGPDGAVRILDFGIGC